MASESVINVSKMVQDSSRCNLGHACSFCPQETTCKRDKPRHNKELLEKRLDNFGMVILVMANKGGVGKSTVAANLAVSLARVGYQVGLADADIHGPNAPRIFGLQDERVKVKADGINTPSYQLTGRKQSLKLGSLAFLLPEPDTPVVWRDAYKHDYIHHMIGSFNWETLDFLVVDMPPGTGNELITLSDLLENSAVRVVLVSSADAVALQDSLKACRFCRERGLPVLGLVENFAGATCPHCNEDFELFPRSKEIECFENAGIPTLARLPFSPLIAQGAESGKPASSDETSPIGRLFGHLAAKCRDAALEESRTTMSRELTGLFEENDGPIELELEQRQEVQGLIEREKQKLQRLKPQSSEHG